MKQYHRALLIGLMLLGFQFSWARSPQPSGQGQRGGGAGQTQPRGRSVTLGDLTSFELKDRVFDLAAGPESHGSD